MKALLTGRRASLVIMRAILLLGAFPLGHLGITSARAFAHGKEVAVTISALSPDRNQPLTKLYRVVAQFADGDPVTNGRVKLLAKRLPDDLKAGPVALSPLNEAGLYAGEFTYPRFGTWTVTVTVSGEGGEGSATLQEELLPLPDLGSTAQPEAGPVRRLQITFKFGWGDAAHLAVRILHSAAGTAYLALTGVTVLAIWFKASETKPQVWGWIKRGFLPGTLAAAGVLLASGLYSAYYDSPIRSPGVFALGAIGRLPYGNAYLVAFWLKAPLAMALLALAWRIHRAMNIPGPFKPMAEAAVDDIGTPTPASPATAFLFRLSLIYVGIGFLLLANIATLIYLHYISHLGGLAKT